MDFAQEGFFDGLTGAALVERHELLEWLVAEGFSDEQLRRAHRRGLLVFLAAEREVGGEPKYTALEVAELHRRRPRAADQAAPRPRPAAARARRDRAHRRRPRQRPHARPRFVELGLTEEQMVATTRVLGRSLATAAEAMRAVVLETVLEPGTTELELAQRYAASVHATLPLVGPMILQMLSQHLRNMVQSEMVGQTERATGQVPGARDQAVAFADLVGFTRLGEEIAPEDLGSVAERLFSVAREVVEPPVRLVKTIGDAVLLTAAEPDALVHTALELVAASDAEASDGIFPQIRVGVAYGPTVARGGDIFGRAVNLASRVTTIARAGSVLATREVRDASADEFRWSSAHARRIKGLPEPVPLYRARSLAAGS